MTKKNAVRARSKARTSVRTWQMEAAFVACILSCVVILTGNVPKEWIGAAAVFFSFMHVQLADRLAEDQAKRDVPSIMGHGWVMRYLVSKEILFFIYFVLSQTWAALAGGLLFLLYPFWRKYYRKSRSLKQPPNLL